MTSETKTRNRPAGTALIVIGAILLAMSAVHLVTAPAVIAAATYDFEVAGKVTGVLLFAGLGVWALVVGINKRKRTAN